MKCVLCGVNDGHDEWCDRNPAKGQPIEYQLARVACAIPVPKGFGQCVDGTDGDRVGTNVATVEEWRQFFVTFLTQGVLPSAEQSEDEPEVCFDCGHEMSGDAFTKCNHAKQAFRAPQNDDERFKIWGRIRAAIMHGFSQAPIGYETASANAEWATNKIMEELGLAE